jgi:hypothetical protein
MPSWQLPVTESPGLGSLRGLPPKHRAQDRVRMDRPTEDEAKDGVDVNRLGVQVTL